MAVNARSKINTSDDMNNLIEEMKVYSRSELLKACFEKHDNVLNMTRSGYIPVELLAISFFLEKRYIIKYTEYSQSL